jgi:hypothetical protein
VGASPSQATVRPRQRSTDTFIVQRTSEEPPFRQQLARSVEWQQEDAAELWPVEQQQVPR